MLNRILRSKTYMPINAKCKYFAVHNTLYHIIHENEYSRFNNDVNKVCDRMSIPPISRTSESAYNTTRILDIQSLKNHS